MFFLFLPDSQVRLATISTCHLSLETFPRLVPRSGRRFYHVKTLRLGASQPRLTSRNPPSSLFSERDHSPQYHDSTATNTMLQSSGGDKVYGESTVILYYKLALNSLIATGQTPLAGTVVCCTSIPPEQRVRPCIPYAPLLSRLNGKASIRIQIPDNMGRQRSAE